MNGKLRIQKFALSCFVLRGVLPVHSISLTCSILPPILLKSVECEVKVNAIFTKVRRAATCGIIFSFAKLLKFYEISKSVPENSQKFSIGCRQKVLKFLDFHEKCFHSKCAHGYMENI